MLYSINNNNILIQHDRDPIPLDINFIDYLEFEINDNENEDELEYLNDLLTLNLENYKNFKNIVSNKRYKEIVRFIIKLKSNFRRLKK